METEQIHHHLTASGHMRKRDIMLSNFLGGLAWGFGSVVGATIVVAIVLWLLGNFNFIPGLNQFSSQVSDTIKSSRSIK